MRLSTTPQPSRTPTRTISEDEPTGNEINARFGSALPNSNLANEFVDLTSNTNPIRKSYVNTSTPAMTLQPRRPKTRLKLTPHEPLPVDHGPPPNGSIRRASNVNGPQPPTSTARSGSQKLATGSVANYKTSSNLSHSPSNPTIPSSGPGSEKINRSPAFFDNEETPKPDSMDYSNEFTLRELIGHTVAEYSMDLPLCCECAPLYYTSLQLELEDVDSELNEMQKFLSSFPTSEELSARVDTLDAEMTSINAHLDRLQLEYDVLLLRASQQEAEIEKCDARTLELQQLKDDFWTRYMRFKHEDLCQQEWKGTVMARLSEQTTYLERLRTSCGLNEVFHISYNGHYATINGLRLGLRSPTLKSNVDWDEVSASFGFLAFLLTKLGTAIGHNWKTARIAPRLDGSFTFIYLAKERSSLPLYVDKEGSWALFRFRDQNSFDRGFEMFVQAFLDVATYAYRRDDSFYLPYSVVSTSSATTIAGHPICSSRSDPEKWTHQVKQLAINIKTLLKWLTRLGNVK